MRNAEPTTDDGVRARPGDAHERGPLTRTLVEIPKMDCPSEERLIRLALEPEARVHDLAFDLGARRLVVHHEGDPALVLDRLLPLGLGARVVRSDPVDGSEAPAATRDDAGEARVLRQLLAINAAMFAFEVALGWVAQSTGLLADAVDMLADAGIYGVALLAVGRSVTRQRRAASLSGVLQLALAAGVLVEVVRRALVGSEPVGALMMGVSLVALVANVACLVLLARHRTGGVHLRASWIFSTSDVVANLGVILAGALVTWTASPVPDLVVGAVVGAVVLGNAVRILRLGRG